VVRPRIYNVHDINEDFEEYLANEEYPTVEGFILKYDYNFDTFYRYLAEEVRDGEGNVIQNPLSETKKKADKKAEDYLQRNALKNTINPIFAMFVLKQKRFGWKDKQEITHGTEDGQPIIIKLEG
jgi:hypothetical protein